MTNACSIYRSYEDREKLFYSPSWMESHKKWSSNKMKSSSGVGSARGSLPLAIEPGDYWQKHINTILEALDYYKKAMHYSGPEILPAEKIEAVALASCRPEEIILAYSGYIFNTEQYILHELRKNNKLPSGLSNKQYDYIAWSQIRTAGFKNVDLNDYLKGLGKLVFIGGLIKNSPIEADSFIERMLFFNHDEWERNRLYFRRGELNVKLGNANIKYLDKAISYFTASAHFTTLEEVSPARIQIYIAHMIEAKVMIAKIYLLKNQPENSLTSLKEAESKIHMIESQMNLSIRDLLKEYKTTLRDTYRKMGRLEDADEITE